MFKYLIVRCYSLNDQYECDANRYPVCLTNTPDTYSPTNEDFYEIYEIKADGSIGEVVKTVYNE